MRSTTTARAEEWRRNGDELAMATLPLDLESVLGELDAGERGPDGMPGGTTMGRVRLQVADIPAAERFYNRGLGLDVMVRSVCRRPVPGGWRLPPPSSGSTPGRARARRRRPEASSAQGHPELVLPSAAERDSAAERLAEAGADPQRLDEGVLTADPSGNRVLLTAPRLLARGGPSPHARPAGSAPARPARVHAAGELARHGAEVVRRGRRSRHPRDQRRTVRRQSRPSRLSPICPVEPAAASVWQLPQPMRVKIARPDS